MPSANWETGLDGTRRAPDHRGLVSVRCPETIAPRTAFGAANPTGEVAPRARIIGLGTPFGDDRAAWEVVAHLDALPPGAYACATSDPLTVVEGPSATELLIVIDACRGAGPPGSVHRFVWPDPRFTTDCGVSSHGVGLTAALELGRVLGRLPPHVIVFAIEGESAAPGGGLSRAVEAALPEVVVRVRAELADESGERIRSAR
jgi:hydrogenase maturation protease